MALFLALRIGVPVVISVGTVIYTLYKLSKNKNQTTISPADLHIRENNDCCFICLEEYKLFSKDKITLPCKHNFHRSCIETVFESEGEPSCPRCREYVPQNFVDELKKRMAIKN